MYIMYVMHTYIIYIIYNVYYHIGATDTQPQPRGGAEGGPQVAPPVVVLVLCSITSSDQSIMKLFM